MGIICTWVDWSLCPKKIEDFDFSCKYNLGRTFYSRHGIAESIPWGE